MEEALRLLSTTKAFDRKWGLSRVSGPTRYFLARFLMTYGKAPVNHRQPDFVDDWLLTDRVVSAALSELAEERILHSEPEKCRTRGRPRTRRWLDGSFVDDLGKQEPGPGTRRFGQLIEHILTSQFESGAGGRRTKLTPYNRLLLAVLIAHADSRGVIANLGITHVRRIAGLSRDQLTSQMSRFAELGYLRGRVSGVSGKRIFGKATGLMYLNLGHPDFGSFGRSQWVVLGPLRDRPPWSARLLCVDVAHLVDEENKISRLGRGVMGPDDERLRSRREQLRSQAEDSERRWGLERSDLSCPAGFQVSVTGELHKFFIGGVSPDTRALLQAHVNELASRMLTTGESLNGFMASRGEGEFAFLTGLLGTSNEEVPDSARLAWVVIVMADHLRQDASKAIDALVTEGHLKSEDLESAEFVIPPPDQSHGFRLGLPLIILTANKLGSRSGGGWVLISAPDRSARFEAFEDEFELDKEKRKRFGLRGKSKSYPEKHLE